MKRGTLFVYSGPSGVGKGTLLKPLLDEGAVTLSVSATTRAPRPGETDGVEYHFVTKEEFEQMIENSEMLEYANYSGNYYGTPRKFVEQQLDSGKNVILEIEVQGAMQVHNIVPEAVMIFVVPPSLRDLRDRLEGRGTETPEVIEKRLAAAAGEIGLAEEYDFVIVNDELSKAKEQLAAIIKSGGCITRLNQKKIEEVLLTC
ncbi:MAG: guanylate kinase [Oscillospiraceae bacterium]|nr:guanylate kinase [Oscillospiraceae bacterium]